MNVSTGVWTGLVVGLVLLLFAAPAIATRVARADGDPRMVRLLMWAAGLKLAAAPLYILVIQKFYGGVADAIAYFGAGSKLADQFRQGHFNVSAGRFVGDGATRISAGIVETVVGNSELGTFFVFSFLAFLGSVLLHRAFRLALPDADAYRYAKLIFFIPSLIFWTAAASKDSLTLLGLGLAAYGGARVFKRQLRGFLWMAAGITLIAIIRPNVALIAVVALALPYPLGRARRPSALSPMVTIAGAAILVIGGVVLAGVAAHHFHLHAISTTSVKKVLDQNAVNTGTAARGQLGDFNSSVSASTSLSPTAIPRDFYDVVIRPLPFQAHSVTELAGSFENIFLVGLMIASWRRLAAAFKAILREPYILAAVIFSVVWIVLFASIGNLGILIRERTQLIPWLLVLVCVRPSPTPPTRRFNNSARPDRGQDSETVISMALTPLTMRSRIGRPRA